MASKPSGLSLASLVVKKQRSYKSNNQFHALHGDGCKKKET
jgi:hypothetical protein